MSDHCPKELFGGSAALWYLAILATFLPSGALTGTLLGFLGDFGFEHTVDNIRANPEIFASQYAGVLVYSAWIGLVGLIAGGVVMTVLLRRTRLREGEKDSSCQKN